MITDKAGSTVTWYVDGLKIAGVNIGATVLSTNIFVGFYDPSSGVSPIPALSFALVDNLRVLSLPRPTIISIPITNSGTQVQIDFTAAVGDTTGSFTLQSAAAINGTFSDASSTITQLSPGSFRVVTAVNGPMQFYRLRR